MLKRNGSLFAVALLCGVLSPCPDESLAQPGPAVAPGVGGPRYAPRQTPPRREPVAPHQARVPHRPVATRPPVARAPFQLTPQQAAFLDQVLARWHQKTGGMRTFKCTFTEWEYDTTFGPRIHTGPQTGRPIAKTKNDGILRYAAPDKGEFYVKTLRHYDRQSGQYKETKGKHGPRWTCDGKAIREYRPKEKLVAEYRLPPEQQGRAIRDTPLPFLFGAEPNKLKSRYFLRVITPQQLATEEVWIEAYPRTAAGARDFRRAILILKRATFLPYALQKFDATGANWKSYQFYGIKVDDPWERIREALSLRVPVGWKLKVEQPPPRAARAAERDPRRPDPRHGLPPVRGLPRR